MSSSTPGVETSYLAAALAGDKQAFADLVETYRRELQVHCYRMLGSLQDAEDLVQETLLRAWKRKDTFEGRAPFRAWLYRIATNACLDELERRPKRGLPFSFYPPADPHQEPAAPVLEPIWIEPYPDAMLPTTRTDPAARFDQLESITLAFLVALQRLPPRQRAILLLRDVVSLSTEEVGQLLETTPGAVHSALYRARQTLAQGFSEGERMSLRKELSRPEDRALLRRYVRAWETADIEGLVSLLKEDATFPMPPLPGWYRGREAIRAFVASMILQGEARGRWRLVPTQANAQPAFGWYRRDPAGQAHQPYAVQVVRVKSGLVAEAITFGYPQLFPAFELPDHLAA